MTSRAHTRTHTHIRDSYQEDVSCDNVTVMKYIEARTVIKAKDVDWSFVFEYRFLLRARDYSLQGIVAMTTAVIT